MRMPLMKLRMSMMTLWKMLLFMLMATPKMKTSNDDFVVDAAALVDVDK